MLRDPARDGRWLSGDGTVLGGNLPPAPGPRVTTRRPRPAPPNKLIEAETNEILATLGDARFVECSPAQVSFTLLDEGIYLVSESTFYRVLRTHDSTKERRRQATHHCHCLR